MSTRVKRIAEPVADDVIAGFAREFAAYRLCPISGAADLTARVKVAARKAGQNFSDVWARIHAAGYLLVDDAQAAK